MDKNMLLAQKKGMAGTDKLITFLIGALVVVVLAVQLAPTMFEGVSDLENQSNTPDWVPAVLYVIIGVGLIFLIWRAFGNK